MHDPVWQTMLFFLKTLESGKRWGAQLLGTKNCVYVWFSSVEILWCRSFLHLVFHHIVYKLKSPMIIEFVGMFILDSTFLIHSDRCCLLFEGTYTTTKVMVDFHLGREVLLPCMCH